ncbi:hypothetical protein [Streptomyces sp. NPDC058683]
MAATPPSMVIGAVVRLSFTNSGGIAPGWFLALACGHPPATS